MVKIDALQTRYRLIAHDLRQLGVDVSGAPVNRDHDTSTVGEMRPEDHHHIGREERNTIGLRAWLQDHAGDDALEVRLHVILIPQALTCAQGFVQSLKEHALERHNESTGVSAKDIIIDGDKIYKHATARINYTSYDLKRDQDVIHPNMWYVIQDTGFLLTERVGSRFGIMVHSPEERPHPWRYAWVLGVFHVNVLYPGARDTTRLDILRVRWLKRDVTVPFGTETCRLERVRFAEDDAYGFVDPAEIIRGCHFVQAFHYGPSSPTPRNHEPVPDDGWKYYYVNRYVSPSSNISHPHQSQFC